MRRAEKNYGSCYMKINGLYQIADEIAPFALSKEYCEKYNSYDNSGVILDFGEEITGVVFSLDCSLAAIGEAKARGANCIFTHHPAIFSPVRSICVDGAAHNIAVCAGAGISVISAHLNLDCAEGGIDDCLMHGLGGAKAEAVMHPLSQGGYGKAYSVEECALEAFALRTAGEFQTMRTVVYGNRPVKRVASFCGAGLADDAVRFALQQGADTLVSSDGKHHLLAELAERGVNVLLLTHYAAENYGFEKFSEKIKNKISGVPAYFVTDERLR